MIRPMLVAMLIATPALDAAAQVAPPPPSRPDSVPAVPRPPRAARAPLASLDLSDLGVRDLDALEWLDRSALRFDVEDALWAAKESLEDAKTSGRWQIEMDQAMHVAQRSLPDLDYVGLSSQLGQRLADGPPAPWAQGDAADSLYRVAREALNRGEYRRASQIFRDVGQRYPNSAYAPDALYWEAFSLYRIGASEELRTALRALGAQQERFGHGSKATKADVAELSTRIRGALAVRGDRTAAVEVARAASENGTSCDKEDLAVRIEALSALGQMDPAATTPIIKRVLSRRDECSASLRRRALYLLGRRADTSATDILIDVARNETDASVRSEAIQWLAKMPGDRAVSTLEEIARSGTNERAQAAAISALGSSDSPRARQSIRALLEKPDASEALRAAALSGFEREHATPEDAAYLRALYGKLESRRLKERTVSAIARLGGPENEQWLLALVRNANEPIEMRAAALGRVGRSLPIADLVKMYDTATERPIRELLLSIYAQRKEPEATDKLLDVVRSGTDPQLRRTAISYLTRKNDPRTTKLLLEIIDK